jgi:hypothetical protein
VRGQHFNLLAQPSRRSTFPGLGNLTRHITGVLVDRARRFSSGRIRAAPWSQSASVAISFARSIEQRLAVIRQGLAARADINVIGLITAANNAVAAAIMNKPALR